MVNFAWSRIQASPMAHIARKLMEEADNEYHNLTHVGEIYQYFADTNEPYDPALDWAVLYHDAIYDELPRKELRSAELFQHVATADWPNNINLADTVIQRAYKLIMDTETHAMPADKDTRMIRGDLHGLASNVTALHNNSKIMEESMRLYGIDAKTFASNGATFMTSLGERIYKHSDIDKAHEHFWCDVYIGVMFTVDLQRFIARHI